MSVKRLIGIGFILIISFPAIVQSQNQSTIRGIITGHQTGEFLEGANISLSLNSGKFVEGTATDKNGLYQFNGLEEGVYILTIRFVGYQSYSDTLQLQENIVKNVAMIRSEESLGEVVVSGVSSDDLVPGQTRINAEDLSRIPTPAGGGDLVSYLQTQSGVVAAGDRGGQLFIRGGTPDQNLVLMDGTLIYQPFHIIGFFSVFSEDVLSSADLYAGGFGPEYSSRTSSVIDVTLKNGNLYNRNWSASLSPFISDVFFETPIRKGKSSLIASFRGSLIEEASALYLDEEQPLKFNSQLVKYNYAGDRGFNCSAHMLRTYDRGKLDFDNDEVFKWRNVVLGGRCAGTSENLNVSFVDANFGISHYTNRVGGLSTNNRLASVFKSNFDVNITQYVGDYRLDYGIFSTYRNVDYDISDRFLSVKNKAQPFLSLGGYVKTNISLGDKVSVVPGVVITSFIQRFKTSLEPRLQVSWQPRGKSNEEIHAAAGIYRQPVVGITDFRDAGAAFTAWMAVPEKSRRMQSNHFLVGWRQPLGDYLDFSVEGYLKQMKDIPVSVWSMTAEFTTDLAYANGDVQGADVKLSYNRRAYYWSMSYGYSETTYTTAQDHFNVWFGEPVQKYHPAHDQRHQISVQTGFKFRDFSANVSWVYGSGMPYTQPLGFDSYFVFLEHLPDVVEDYGSPRILLEKPFQGRLPDFHRLDVSIEQAFDISNTKMRVQLGAINMYDRNNLFYYDVYYQTTIYQLPILPYMSIKIGSK
ncbi:TonB-dependent receptor [Rhodohalobacter sp. 614A]|uniref:TonB-dependent receptor n=1 Tax=Rhodohalobacter sp. 614A TaxID=2908649 RepID=UPI001F47A485|nr:TonB-dependent receptor [Rhodohalobacter sp. 614A]